MYQASMTRTHTTPALFRRGRALAALTGAMTLGMLFVSPAHAQTATPAKTDAKTDAKAGDKADAKAKPAQATQDILIFRNGNKLTGTIVSMTDKVVRFRSTVNGIPFEVDYQRDQISDIQRGVKVEGTPAEAPTKADAKPAMTPAVGATPGANVPSGTTPTTSDATTPDDGRKRVYWIDLEGRFGEDISQTPIRDVLEDAKKNKSDVIMVYLNNTWEARSPDGDTVKDAAGMANNFDELRRAEKIMPALTDEIAANWEKAPKIIFWIRRAMGGCAFIPLISSENYFTSDGKLGGIGNLDTVLDGNERVVAKQVSLRLQHAVGWARKGGYGEPLVRALTLPEFVLTVKLVDGKPQFFERYPETPDEELLTDDGKGVNRDTLDKFVRGEGNDVLTLNARTAKLINFSQGTVDTRDELLATTGLDREGIVIDGRSKKIMKDWSDGLDRGQKQLRKLVEELQEIRVNGERAQRVRARGAMINKIEQIKGLLRRYLEAWDWRFLNELGVPLNGERQANIEALTGQQESLKLQNLGDK